MVLVVFWGLNFEFFGRLKYDLDPFPPNIITLLSPDSKIFLHWSGDQFAWSLANFIRLDIYLAFKSGTFLGLLVYRLGSLRYVGTVCTVAFILSSFLGSVADLKGSFLLIDWFRPTIIRPIDQLLCKIFHPLSNFGWYHAFP